MAEELGWARPLGRLLVVDYVRPQDSRPEGVVFVFDGDRLDEGDLAGIVLADEELLSASLHTVEAVRSKVKPLLASRLEAALAAVREGVTALCEQGLRVG